MFSFLFFIIYLLLGRFNGIKVRPLYKSLLDDPSINGFSHAEKTNWKTYLEEQLVPAVLSFYEKAVILRPEFEVPTTYDVKSLSYNCQTKLNNIIHTEAHNSFMGDQIFIIFGLFSDCRVDAPFLTTTLCFQDFTYGGRSTSGLIRFNICPQKLKVPMDLEKDFLVHTRNIYSLMHEVLHVLAFHPELVKNFQIQDPLNPKGYSKKFSKKDSALDWGRVTRTGKSGLARIGKMYNHIAYLKKHFNSNDADIDKGAYMDLGPSGTHFDSKIYGGDVMSALTKDWQRSFSAFTATFLEDSGWYKVNQDFIEPNNWGRNQPHFLKDSSNYPKRGIDTSHGEFCAPPHNGKGSTFCDVNNLAGGTCSNTVDNLRFLSSLTPPQPLRTVEPDAYSLCNKHSRCFNVQKTSFSDNLWTSYCYKTQCYQASGDYEIQIFNPHVETTERCKSLNQEIILQDDKKTNKKYTLICPDPTEFCEAKKKCPRNCMGRGDCLLGLCYCQPLKNNNLVHFSGADCSIAKYQQFEILASDGWDDIANSLASYDDFHTTNENYEPFDRKISGNPSKIRDKTFEGSRLLQTFSLEDMITFKLKGSDCYLAVFWSLKTGYSTHNEIKVGITNRTADETLKSQMASNTLSGLVSIIGNTSKWISLETHFGFTIKAFLNNKAHTALKLSILPTNQSFEDSLVTISPVMNQNLNLKLSDHRIYQISKSDKLQQKWKIIKAFQNFYYIQNQDEQNNPNGQYLYANILTGLHAGTIISKFFEPEDDNFLWQITKINEDYFQIRSYNIPLFLDNQDISLDYEPLNLFPERNIFTNSNSQKFIFRAI